MAKLSYLAAAASTALLFLKIQAFQDNFADPIPIIEELSNLALDINSRLANHWLLFQDTPQCRTLIENAWTQEQPMFRNIATYTQDIGKLFGIRESSICTAINLVKGTSFDLIGHAIPTNILTLESGAHDIEILADWLKEHQIVELGWTSHSPADMTLYWLDNETGERVENGKLVYGERNTLWIQSVLGHEFDLLETVSRKVVGEYTAQFDAFHAIGQAEEESRLRKMDVTQEVEHTLHDQWQRSKNIKRTFTDLGFTLGKLPRDLFGSMSAYYYNNADNKIREEWDNKGIYVNWWEADVFMVGMPFGLKRYWQMRLQDLVEEWSGVELELTDIYGMRRYEEGARLLTHVDREATHAASLIINIAQGGVREPWAVEIYDFADRMHEITMEEGDIIYYESARCLHGRMKPLQGAFYVNLFAHYRPIGDPNWYRKRNPADSVPHLLDIGECHLDGKVPNCTSAEGRVPFLSPQLETLQGAADLFKYWLKTSPNQKDEL